MELTYILIAAAIIILPVVLTKLLSGKSRDTEKVMGACTPAEKAAAAPGDSESLTGEVKALLAQGKKIEAIKLARAKTGLPLEAAKDRVETIERSGTARPHTAGLMDTIRQAREIHAEAQKLVAQGKKIEAIALIHERTGVGLKAAKEIVDQMG